MQIHTVFKPESHSDILSCRIQLSNNVSRRVYRRGLWIEPRLVRVPCKHGAAGVVYSQRGGEGMVALKLAKVQCGMKRAWKKACRNLLRPLESNCESSKEPTRDYPSIHCSFKPWLSVYRTVCRSVVCPVCQCLSVYEPRGSMCPSTSFHVYSSLFSLLFNSTFNLPLNSRVEFEYWNVFLYTWNNLEHAVR